MPTREHIIAEIRRTAEANSGVPLGRRRFARETGIRDSDWFGKFWTTWGEAVTAAGYQPNTLREPYTDKYLLEKLASLTAELGHFPRQGDLRLKRRQDPSFPPAKPFRRFGKKAELAARLLAHCEGADGATHIADLCRPFVTDEEDVSSPSEAPEYGYVYLLKSGGYYKIGYSKAPGRREAELAIQLPERACLVHEIRTDDPRGIEAYWHRRFSAKRQNGEWFKLSQADVKAFGRRKFM